MPDGFPDIVNIFSVKWCKEYTLTLFRCLLNVYWRQKNSLRTNNGSLKRIYASSVQLCLSYSSPCKVAWLRVKVNSSVAFFYIVASVLLVFPSFIGCNYFLILCRLSARRTTCICHSFPFIRDYSFWWNAKFVLKNCPPNK